MRQSPGKRNIILLVLLALICIGTSELIACRIFDPVLFQKITAPVYTAAHSVSQFAQNTVESWATNVEQWQEQRAAAKEERAAALSAQEQNQLADNPAIEAGFPIADPSVTELKLVNGTAILTGGTAGEVYYFNQSEEPWASQNYGRDDIARYGCGPTVMAMVVASFTDTETDPAVMSQWAYEQGYWASQSGSYLSIVEGTAQAFGLHVESLTEHTPEAMQSALLAGKVLVALMGPGHFTKGGHFILLHGITLNGEILVADPNSTERTLTTWDAQLILDELSTSTSDGAPLWVISAH